MGVKPGNRFFDSPMSFFFLECAGELRIVALIERKNGLIIMLNPRFGLVFFVTNVPNEKGNNHTLLAAAHQFGCKLQLPCQLLEPFREKKRKKIGCGPNRWQRRIRPRKL